MSELSWWLQQGDSLEVLKTLPTASVDALVTDPPAGIGFMGREWDSAKGGRDAWIEWLASVLRECRRVMKSGAYGWVWSLPRTSHWTGMACELAGFEVRDTLDHVFGTGFPKSRALLKPAKEVWWLVKAPGELRELRIEENRIGAGKQVPGSPPKAANQIFGARPASAALEESDGYNPNVGRWPANFALSHSEDCANECVEGCPVRELDEQSAERCMHSAGTARDGSIAIVADSYAASTYQLPKNRNMRRLGDSGGASRFFYVAKSSKRERSAGLGDDRNTHTTVKSIALMEHIVSLVAAPGALVLDPFTGSGSTGIAAVNKGCRFVGIEQSEEYCDIARRRIAHHAGTIKAHERTDDTAGVPGHDAPAHHADHGLHERDQPAAGLPAQRAEGEPAAAGAGGAVDARE